MPNNDLELQAPLLASSPDGTNVGAVGDNGTIFDDFALTTGEGSQQCYSKTSSRFEGKRGNSCFGGLICVMLGMILFALIMIVVSFNAVATTIMLGQAMESMDNTLSQVHFTFTVSSTINVKHYNGIVDAGGPAKATYKCKFEGEGFWAICSDDKNDDDQAIITFQETGPVYSFYRNGPTPPPPAITNIGTMTEDNWSSRLFPFSKSNNLIFSRYTTTDDGAEKGPSPSLVPLN